MKKSIHHGCPPTSTERDREANKNWWHPRSNFLSFRPKRRLKQTEIYSPAEDWSYTWLPLFFLPSFPTKKPPFLHIYSQAHQEWADASEWQSYPTIGGERVLMDGLEVTSYTLDKSRPPHPAVSFFDDNYNKMYLLDFMWFDVTEFLLSLHWAQTVQPGLFWDWIIGTKFIECSVFWAGMCPDRVQFRSKYKSACLHIMAKQNDWNSQAFFLFLLSTRLRSSWKHQGLNNLSTQHNFQQLARIDKSV